MVEKQLIMNTTTEDIIFLKFDESMEGYYDLDDSIPDSEKSRLL